MIYFVATPIGNLKDITLRAIEVLESVDVIACEDTRNSLKLLNHFGIKKKLISYHKFNEKSSADGIVLLAKEGKNIAVISDSGMPLISDPGHVLVKRLKEEELAYTVIGGVSASLNALVLSGQSTERFLFLGFLPEKKPKEFLEKYKNVDASLIFYVAPHSLKKDLEVIASVLKKRKASLVNEISKMYEKIFDFELDTEGSLACECTSCAGLGHEGSCKGATNCTHKLSSLEEIEPRGEYVLVVEGAKESEVKLNNLSINEHIDFYIKTGLDQKEAIKKVAKDRGTSKSEIYSANLKNK